MNIDQCIILAAGFGTRMGEIGKKLPKVMWPLFEYSLLETQILFAASLGVKNFYINTHFQSEQIKIKEEFYKNFTIEFIHEEILLGSGGGIHNIFNYSSLNRSKPVLILNSDAYFLLDQSDITKALNKLENSKAGTCLYPVPCLKSDPYNRLVSQDNILTAISAPHDSSQSDVTYAGVAICIPERLGKKSGKSNFFDSVADYKNTEVLVLDYDNWEFIDFGTSHRYFAEVLNVLDRLEKKEETSFIKFLKNEIIDLNQLNLNLMSYRSECEKQINFTKEQIQLVHKGPCIIVSKPKANLEIDETGMGLIYQDIFQKEVR